LKTRDGKVSFPPQNRTNWNDAWLKRMRDWLKTVTVQIKWRPEDCLAAFPSHPHNVETLEKAIQELRRQKPQPGPGRWMDNPNPVDAPVIERLSEVLAERKNLCYYDEQLQDETYLYYKIIYDPSTYEGEFVTNIRLLIWFYQFFFFENWKQDLWSKRFIRDHLRYKDELQCIAARIVAAMREKARAKHDGDDQFDSFHIRRLGEFEEQYGNLTDNAAIYNTSVPDIPEGSTVYIATDDMNRTLFQPLMDHYDVYFLGDFQELLGDLNANYYSIIDQLVASRGRVFFGAFCSTFTGYINRMRGYRSQKDKAEGWQNGIVDSYFYNFQGYDKRNKMRIYHPPIKSWFFREFPIAWRDIDHDLESYEGEDR
jgi:GDP-fucose protein O-fucosyltransferase